MKKSIWFTGDQHFYHSKIISYCNRPFKSGAQAAWIMLRRWNEKVKKDDHVYHLGDLAFLSKSDLKEFVWKLNGKIFMVKGGHDHYLNKRGIVERFEWVKDYHELTVQGKEFPRGKQKIILCHYPIEEWEGKHYGTWHFHAHSHGNKNGMNLNIARIDVGVDNYDFYPVSFEDISETMYQKIILR